MGSRVLFFSGPFLRHTRGRMMALRKRWCDDSGAKHCLCFFSRFVCVFLPFSATSFFSAFFTRVVGNEFSLFFNWAFY
jgi:hypothetical protein